jgi:hypothetical protein
VVKGCRWGAACNSVAFPVIAATRLFVAQFVLLFIAFENFKPETTSFNLLSQPWIFRKSLRGEAPITKPSKAMIWSADASYKKIGQNGKPSVMGRKADISGKSLSESLKLAGQKSIPRIGRESLVHAG